MAPPLCLNETWPQIQVTRPATGLFTPALAAVWPRPMMMMIMMMMTQSWCYQGVLRDHIEGVFDVLACALEEIESAFGIEQEEDEESDIDI
jgi:hypothetical protein